VITDENSRELFYSKYVKIKLLLKEHKFPGFPGKYREVRQILFPGIPGKSRSKLPGKETLLYSDYKIIFCT